MSPSVPHARPQVPSGSRLRRVWLSGKSLPNRQIHAENHMYRADIRLNIPLNGRRRERPHHPCPEKSPPWLRGAPTPPIRRSSPSGVTYSLAGQPPRAPVSLRVSLHASRSSSRIKPRHMACKEALGPSYPSTTTREPLSYSAT